MTIYLILDIKKKWVNNLIGVLISSKKEFNELLKIYNIGEDYLEKYPFGEYYRTEFRGKDIVFFRSGIRKINASAAAQYMIDKFNLEKLIVIGTCTSSNEGLNYGDIIIPSKVIDYDYIIRELEEEIDEELYLVPDQVSMPNEYYDGVLGTSDKALVLWSDYTFLASNSIDASDLESYAVLKICKTNNVKCIIIKGVTDKPMRSMDGYNEQLDVYEENLPIVMKKIIEEYFIEVI